MARRWLPPVESSINRQQQPALAMQGILAAGTLQLADLHAVATRPAIGTTVGSSSEGSLQPCAAHLLLCDGPGWQPTRCCLSAACKCTVHLTEQGPIQKLMIISLNFA